MKQIVLPLDAAAAVWIGPDYILLPQLGGRPFSAYDTLAVWPLSRWATWVPQDY